MAVLLLGVVMLACLALIPLGLPGTWLMVGAAVGYDALVGGGAIGWVTITLTALLAFGAEVAEFSLAGRYARKYGGSRRAEWGAVLGGVAGAIVGVPIPIVGSVAGAFAGAFAGAWIGERTRGTTLGASTRVAGGALVGRLVSAVLKVVVGCVIAAWLVVAAWV